MGVRDYLLVTPCKNEEDSLPKLAESVTGQDITPLLWVIVNDGSTDKTSEILADLCSRHLWIQVVNLSEKPRNLGIHVSHVYRIGFDAARRHCEENNLNYDYIASVDADIILDNNYFSSLMAEFKADQKLGICSGHIGNLINGAIIWSKYKEDLPSGGARLWSKKCFEETGGYLLTCSPDSVSNVKAKLKDWNTRHFASPKAISTRAYSSAQGQWRGYRKLGSNNYFIGYSPIHACLKGVKLLYSKNGYFVHGVGIAYVFGYFYDLISNKPRIDDKEVLEYYKNSRLKELLCSMFSRPKSSK
jgi:Glycosyltransferases, probably involved in cell wall biogenesis